MKKPNMKGIIHKSMRLVDCWRGSALRGELIFCMTHMEPPTSTAMKYVATDLSATARSRPRNRLSSGTTWWTTDSHGYRCPESPARDSGLVGSTWMMDMYSPIQMGNWMTKGPRHPMGFTPDSLYSFMVS